MRKIIDLNKIVRLIIILFGLLTLILTGFFCIADVACTKVIDYSKLEKVKWEELFKIYIAIDISDLSLRMRAEILNEKKVSEDIILRDERWVTKKIDKKRLLIPVVEKDGFINIYWNNRIAIPGVDSFSIGIKKFNAYVYEFQKNYLIGTGTYALFEYDKKNEKGRVILEMLNERENDCNALRTIQLQNECLFTIGWVNEGEMYPDYAYMKIYRYNLLKKEVYVFDSYPLGILVPPIDEIEGYYPRYDISMDKRFVYIPALTGKGYTDPNTFRREKVKINGGLYVYDWEKEKVYKLAEGNVAAVTNNTDDGYVYYKTESYENNELKYDYYRIKNPEEMLKKL